MDPPCDGDLLQVAGRLNDDEVVSIAKEVEIIVDVDVYAEGEDASNQWITCVAERRSATEKSRSELVGRPAASVYGQIRRTKHWIVRRFTWPVTWVDVGYTLLEYAVKLKPVMAVAAMGETAMFPVMWEFGTVEMPDLERIT
jgi:hypothetical protein